MVTFWPAAHPQVDQGHKEWIREVEERTNGQVQINLHPGESLLGAAEIFNGVADGVADIGTTCPSYTPGMFPLAEVFELPGYENVNALAASKTAHEGYQRIRSELGVDEFSEVKVLMFWATGPGNIMSQNRISSLEDMSGTEIRAAGGSAAQVKALGAVHHAMPMSEAYLALDQGIMDSILAPSDTLQGFKLAEVVDYVTKTPFLYNMVFMKVMNKETWSSLPQEAKEVFEDLNREFVVQYGELFHRATRQGLEYGKESHGLEVIDLEPEEEKRWIKSLDPVVRDWIQERSDQGLPAQEALEIVRELDAKYSDKYRER